MKHVNLKEYFVEKMPKGQPLNSPKDIAILHKINKEMKIVQLKFHQLSAESWSRARDIILRRSR